MIAQAEVAPSAGEIPPADAAVPETAIPEVSDEDTIVVPLKSKGISSAMHRIVHVDAVTGARSTTYFDLRAKIAALKLIGMHLGLFEKGKGYMKAPNIIWPSEMLTNHKQAA